MAGTVLEVRQVGLTLLLLVVAVAALQPTTTAITPSNTWTNLTSSSTTKQTVSVVPYSTWLQSVTHTLAQTIISKTVSTNTVPSACYWLEGYYYCAGSYYYPPPPAACYGYACYPNYAYQVTTTATSYSTFTETSITTSTTTSSPDPVTKTTTLTSTTATADTTKETVYGTLMVGFLALFLVTLFLFATFRSRPSNPRQPQTQQASITTSYRCGACETEVVPNAKFCGNCGALLKR